MLWDKLTFYSRRHWGELHYPQSSSVTWTSLMVGRRRNGSSSFTHNNDNNVQSTEQTLTSAIPLVVSLVVKVGGVSVELFCPSQDPGERWCWDLQRSDWSLVGLMTGSDLFDLRCEEEEHTHLRSPVMCIIIRIRAQPSTCSSLLQVSEPHVHILMSTSDGNGFIILSDI